MHVANLQLEGLLMAVAAINNVLVEKGILTADEIDGALRKAEASFATDQRPGNGMSPSHRDALCFPIRLLAQANQGRSQCFADLARAVGKAKEA